VHGRLLEANEALLLLPIWSVLEEANHILDCELQLGGSIDVYKEW
jgi:hypothetical protein